MISALALDRAPTSSVRRADATLRSPPFSPPRAAPLPGPPTPYLETPTNLPGGRNRNAIVAPEGLPSVALPDDWHAIRTRAGKEISVAEVLTTHPFSLEVYCPRYPATYVRRHRRVSELVPYLPTYLFARWDARDAYLWHALRAIPHLHGFLGNPASPDPIPDHHLAALRALIGDAGELVAGNELRRRSLPVGDPVLINRGPFAARPAVVVSVDDATIFTIVRISGVLGRDHEIKLPTEWCDRLTPFEPVGTLATTARSGPRPRRRRENGSSEGRDRPEETR